MIICLKTQPNKIFLVKVDDDVYAGWMDGWISSYTRAGYRTEHILS